MIFLKISLFLNHISIDGFTFRIYFKLFWRHTKTGNWFSTIQDIAISYTRNDLYAMREEMSGYAFEFGIRGRR